MNTLLHDLRYGMRMLMKNPGFAALAVLTLALGIGATTAIFSVVYGVLLRPLPYPKPDQIVDLREVNAKGVHTHFADPNFADIRSQNHTLQGAAEYSAWLQSVSGGSEPTRTIVASVSRDFFPLMVVEPVLGRGFAPEDQRFGAAPVALVSYAYWKHYLGGATDLTRLKLTIDKQFCSVIGVLPPGFRFPSDTELWIPRELWGPEPGRSSHNWLVVARLRDGVKLAQARAELTGIAQRLKQQYGQDTMMVDVAVSPLRAALTSDVRPALLVLLGAVGFLLLVACANVVNLLMAQAAAREKELAIRSALGAGRKRLVRQLLTEALLLAVGGGALGILAAIWGVDALVAIAPSDLPRLHEVAVNLSVLSFTFVLSVAVAAGLGIFTALRSASGESRGPQHRGDALHEVLAERGEGQTSTVRGHRLSRTIVAAQLATTVVLLVGAGLLGRSLLRVLEVNPGFRTERILTMDLALPSIPTEADRVHRVAFLNEVFSRFHAIPGVREVGGVDALPLTGGLPDGFYVLMNLGEKQPSDFDQKLWHDPTRSGDADYCLASEGYFRALGIPLLRGRLFDQRDTMGAPHVALISESLAREKWPNQDPLGHSIEFGNMDGDLRLLTVVGVVGDVREYGLETKPRPTIYVDYRQRPGAMQATGGFVVVLRTAADPAMMFAEARNIVRSLDPNVPPSFNTFAEVFSASLKTRRFNLTLVGVFAATALLLGAAGIYGVMAHSVVRRTHEIGVRMALGASPPHVLRLVLSQGMLTAVVGLAIGIAGALALTRAMQSLLFGVSPTDPLTLSGVALVVGLAALLATYIPARRATQVDPMVALRHE